MAYSMGLQGSKDTSASGCVSIESIALVAIWVQSRGAQLPGACFPHGRGQKLQVGKGEYVLSFKAQTQNWHLSLLSKFYCTKEIKRQAKVNVETKYTLGGVESRQWRRSKCLLNSNIVIIIIHIKIHIIKGIADYPFFNVMHLKHLKEIRKIHDGLIIKTLEYIS